MYRLLTLIVFLLFSNLVSAQSLYKEVTAHKVTINHPEGTRVFFTMRKKKDLSTQPDRDYFWYSAGKINTTRGGYSGKPLDGLYTAFYSDKNLEEQGDFKKGLKSGEWKYWYPNGKLKETLIWSQGKKQGAFSEFNESGKLTRSGHYKNGKLHGKIKTYGDEDSIISKKYKDDKPVIEKEKVANPNSRINKMKDYISKKFSWVKKESKPQ